MPPKMRPFQYGKPDGKPFDVACVLCKDCPMTRLLKRMVRQKNVKDAKVRSVYCCQRCAAQMHFGSHATHEVVRPVVKTCIDIVIA